MCNECGNCETFCPYSSAPYKDKFTLFSDEDDFSISENPGFVPLKDGTVRVRIDGKAANHSDGKNLPEGIWPLIQAAMNMGYLMPIAPPL
jgi:putative selenate reductase